MCKASDRHVSRNELYLAALTPPQYFCPYFSTSGRMASWTSHPLSMVINTEHQASNSSISPKGFVYPFPLKGRMLSHPVKMCIMTFLLSQFSDIDDSIVATGSCKERQETTKDSIITFVSGLLMVTLLKT